MNFNPNYAKVFVLNHSPGCLYNRIRPLPAPGPPPAPPFVAAPLAEPLRPAGPALQGPDPGEEGQAAAGGAPPGGHRRRRLPPAARPLPRLRRDDGRRQVHGAGVHQIAQKQTPKR